MTTLTLRHYGAATPVPLGPYLVTLTTDVGWQEGDIIVTEPRTLGTLAAELTAKLSLPGTLVDLVITQR
ncbi:hypothetical protein ABZW30_12490 [Kitasatospora sp. NPDC004669]|uniref:hypothetical protein n=1 Tax=Kitasatospora sp. NPDC004669 TaxID=3154555 RepID=UPI0033B57EB4